MSSYPPVYPPAAEPQLNPAWGPFTPGELVRRIFTLYKAYPGVFIGISAVATLILCVPQVPLIAVQRVMLSGAGAAPSPARAIAMMPAFLLLYFVTMFTIVIAYALAGGGLFSAVMAIRRGETPTVTGSLNAAAKRFWAAFGATFMVGLRLLGWYLLVAIPLIFGVALLAVPIGVAKSSQTGAPSLSAGVLIFSVAIVAGLLLVAFLLWQYSRYFVTLGAMYTEGAGVNQSIRRAITLSRGHKGGIFAVIGTVFLLSLAGAMILVPLAFLAFYHQKQGGPAGTLLLVAALQIVLGGIFQAVVQFPVLGIGMSLCYLDMRMRESAVPAMPPPLDAQPQGWAPSAPAPVLPPPTAPAEPKPYLSATYDAPRAFRMDPGRSVPLAEVVPSKPEPEPTPESGEVPQKKPGSGDHEPPL